MAYDPALGAVVLFGGYNLSSASLSDSTWEYKAGVWTEITTANPPSARYDAAMAYDSADGYLLLFGGITSFGNPNSSFSGTTWELNSEMQWEVVNPTYIGESPASSGLNFVALSTGPDGDLLVGATPGSTGLLTWTYADGTWEQIFANVTTAYDVPPALTSDSATGTFYLWDGNAMLTLSEPTSQKGFAWESMGGSPPPNPQSELYSAPLLVFDPNANEPVYFGTSGSTQSSVEETWMYDGTSWHELSPASSPSEGLDYAISSVYDTADHYTLLLQASASPFSGVGWHAFDWAFPPPLTVLSVSVSKVSADVDQWISFNTSATGGYVPYEYNWTVPSSTFPCANSTDQAFSCAVAAPGTPSVNSNILSCITVALKCETIESASSTSISLDLSPALTLAVTPNRGSLDRGQWVNLTSAAGGGVGPYTLTWNTPPFGWTCLATSAGESCQPGATILGQSNLTATISDANGAVFTGIASVMVDPDPAVSLPRSNVTSTDVGQSMTLHVNSTGGTGVYYYVWSVAGLGCIRTNASTPYCQTLVAGDYPVTVTVSDTNGFQVTSPILTFPVFADPTVTSFAAQFNPVDSNVPDPMHVLVSGGAGNFTYSWPQSLSGCTGTTTSTPICTLSGPIFNPISFTVEVRDSNGLEAVSKPLNLTVDGLPSATLGENRTVLDENETIQFTAMGSGGTPPYSYAYSGLPSGCTSQDTPVLNCTPTVNGTFSVSVNITDNGGGWSGPSTAVAFIVYHDTRITSVGPDTKAEDPPYWPVNETYVNAWVGPLFRWTNGDNYYRGCVYAPGSDLQGINCDSWNSSKVGEAVMDYASPGAYPITVSVLDSTGFNVTYAWTITVYALPAAVTESGPSSVDLGVDFDLTGTLAGGSTPFTVWYNDTTIGQVLCALNVSSGNGTSCRFHLSSLGSQKIEYTVHFSMGAGEDGGPSFPIPAEETSNWTILVVPDIAVAAFIASAGTYSSRASNFSTEVGASVTLSASLSGGTGPYMCSFWMDAHLLAEFNFTSGQCPSFLWTPSTAGMFYLNVSSADADGKIAASSLLVQVSKEVNLQSFHLSEPTPEVGMLVNVSVAIVGGFTAYAFNWSFGDGTYQSTLEPWVDHAWAGNTSYTVLVRVIDGQSASVVLSAKVTCILAPSLSQMKVVAGPLNYSAISNGGIVSLPTNSTPSFDLTESGGASPYNYTWMVDGVVLSASTTGSQLVRFSHPWELPGNYSLTLLVVDAEKGQVGFSIEVEISWDFSGRITLEVPDPDIDLGMTEHLSASVPGGTAPYTFDWKLVEGPLDLEENSSSPYLNVTPTATGVLLVELTVHDYFHSELETSDSVSVNSDLSVDCAPTFEGVPVPGSNVTFSLACVNGGSAPYQYIWSVDAQNVSTSSNTLTFSFSQLGSFPVLVTVVDAVGQSVASSSILVGTIPPEITGADAQVLNLSGHGGTFSLSLQVTLTTQEVDGIVSEYTWQYGAGPASPWTALDDRMILVNLSGDPGTIVLAFEVKDLLQRTSSVYDLPVSLSSYWAERNQTGTPSPIATYYGLLVTVVPYLVLVLVVLVALIVLALSRRPASPGKGGGTPSDPVAAAILGALKQTPRLEGEELVSSVQGATRASEGTIRDRLGELVEERRIGKDSDSGGPSYFLPELIPPGTVENTEEDVEHRTASEAMILDVVARGSGGVSISELKEDLTETNLSKAELYRYVSDLLTTGRLWAERGETSEEMRLHVTEASRSGSKEDNAVRCDEKVLRDLEDQLGGMDREDRPGGVLGREERGPDGDT